MVFDEGHNATGIGDNHYLEQRSLARTWTEKSTTEIYEDCSTQEQKATGTGRMKVVSICTMRYNRDTAEPVMLSQVNELSSFGFFQRQG